MQEKAIALNASTTYSLKHRLKDYGQLMKFRLSFSVVFSSAMGYLLACKGGVVWVDFINLCLGGLLIVGASNGINQIIERNYDKLMTRTENRPMATQRLGLLEASILCLVLGVAGVMILGLGLNKLTGLLGLLSLICIYPTKTCNFLERACRCIPGRNITNDWMGCLYWSY